MLAVSSKASCRVSAAPSPSQGEPGPPAATLRVDVGWAGWIPLQAWLPVHVDLQASLPIDGEVVVDVPVQGYDAPLSFRQPVRLLPGAPQRVAIEAFIPDTRGVLAVRLVASGREVTRRDVSLSTTRAVEAVVLALTHEPAGLEFLSELTRKIRAAYITEEDLPAQWQGYTGVRLLVIRDFNERAISPAQRRGLEQWVAQGGRLLVTGGAPLVTLQAPWLLRMLPADPGGLVNVRRPDDLSGVPGPISATTLRLRRALRRAGRVRGGWLAVPLVATLFGLAMYGVALQARRAGTSVVQVSIAEGIPGTGLARVRTFAALISPYGGTFHLHAAEDAWMQPAEPRPLTFDAPFAISGNAATSGLRVDATEVVPASLDGYAATSDADRKSVV